jgi:hypothetical protein
VSLEPRAVRMWVKGGLGEERDERHGMACSGTCPSRAGGRYSSQACDSAQQVGLVWMSARGELCFEYSQTMSTRVFVLKFNFHCEMEEGGTLIRPQCL